jgi:TonB family protein
MKPLLAKMFVVFCVGTLFPFRAMAVLQNTQQTSSSPQENQVSTHQDVTSRGKLEIVSGHEGLDATQYMGAIFTKLNAQHVFQAGSTPGTRSGNLVVEFVIQRDGSVGYTKVIKSTVDQGTSQAQMDAIRSAAPFPALPKGFKGKLIKVRLHSEFIPKEPSSKP